MNHNAAHSTTDAPLNLSKPRGAGNSDLMSTASAAKYSPTLLAVSSVSEPRHHQPPPAHSSKLVPPPPGYANNAASTIPSPPPLSVNNMCPQIPPPLTTPYQGVEREHSGAFLSPTGPKSPATSSASRENVQTPPMAKQPVPLPPHPFMQPHPNALFEKVSLRPHPILCFFNRVC